MVELKVKAVAKVEVKKTNVAGMNKYTGRVDVYENGVFIFSEYAKDVRVCYETALADAVKLIKKLNIETY